MAPNVLVAYAGKAFSFWRLRFSHPYIELLRCNCCFKIVHAATSLMTGGHKVWIHELPDRRAWSVSTAEFVSRY